MMNQSFLANPVESEVLHPGKGLASWEVSQPTPVRELAPTW